MDSNFSASSFDEFCLEVRQLVFDNPIFLVPLVARFGLLVCMCLSEADKNLREGT